MVVAAGGGVALDQQLTMEGWGKVRLEIFSSETKHFPEQQTALVRQKTERLGVLCRGRLCIPAEAEPVEALEQRPMGATEAMVGHTGAEAEAEGLQMQGLPLALAVMAATGSSWSQPISNMNTYAIIDDQGGWLVNLILWDGNPETWQPPAGTRAVLASEVDFAVLPTAPDLSNND